MECSGSVCSSYRKNRLKRVSILVFRWNALEDCFSAANFFSKKCFNPSFSMECSGSLNESSAIYDNDKFQS